MVPTTQRPASTGRREVTRNFEVPGMEDEDGQPFVVTLRRLPAGETYLYWGDGKAQEANVPETWRRWAQQAIVAPAFSFNGTRDGIVWDELTLPEHAALGQLIAAYSFEVSAEARALQDAFRGGQPAGAQAGDIGGRPGDDGGVAPGESALSAVTGPSTDAGGGAGV